MKLLNKHKATPEELQTAIYIGRGSPLGNPYVIGVHGDRLTVITMYRPYLARELIRRNPKIENAFRSLTPSSNLLCFCTPKPCHGAVIEEFHKELFPTTSYEESLKLFEERHRHEIEAASHLDKPLKELETSNVPTTTGVEDRRAQPITYDPLEDGITHINVWSKAKTELGRLASNFARTPFLHPVHGHFASVEGYWYWLSLGMKYNELRSLSGHDAKQVGSLMRKEALESAANNTVPFPEVPDFEAQIKKAILCKVEQNLRFQELLRDSTLPLAHYYVWGEPPNYKVTVPSEFAWTYQYLEIVRSWLKGDAYKLIIAGSRGIDSVELVRKWYSFFQLKAVEIVSGGARGVDHNGEELAAILKLPIARFPADWDTHGKSAGFIRNGPMVDYVRSGIGSGAGLILWDGNSPGTKSTIDLLEQKDKPCFLVTLKSMQDHSKCTAFDPLSRVTAINV